MDVNVKKLNRDVVVKVSDTTEVEWRKKVGSPKTRKQNVTTQRNFLPNRNSSFSF